MRTWQALFLIAIGGLLIGVLPITIIALAILILFLAIDVTEGIIDEVKIRIKKLKQ